MSAFCFVLAVYGEDNFERIDPLGEDAARIFSQGALADLAAARARSADDLDNRFGSNPLCACNSPGLLDLLTAGVGLDADGRVVGTAVLTAGPIDERLGVFGILARIPPERRVDVRLILVRESEGWRIDDILDEEDVSFRSTLAP